VRLYPFQEEGREFLAARRTALLADQMGLGKTAQAITAARQIGAEKIGVICPASVRAQWEQQFSKWWPAGDFYLGVQSYDSAREAEPSAIPRYDVLVLDEAHYLKNPTVEPEKDEDNSLTGRTVAATGRVRAVYGKGGWAHHADRIWALTGTPAPNNVSELWTHLYILGRTKLGYEEFVRRFCKTVVGDWGPRIVGARNVEELRGLLDGFMLRRFKDDVLPDLPPIRWDTVTLDGRDDISLPNDLAAELEHHVAEDTNPLSGVRLEPEGHIATARRELGIKKIKPAAELIRDEIAGGLDKLVVFAYHRDVIWGLTEALGSFGIGAVSYHGGHSDTERARTVECFMNEPACQVAVVQYDAGGTGLDGLQVAANALFVEWSWTPATNVQAAMRLHRIGQNRGVLIRFAEMNAPLDQAITRVAARKAADLAPVFGSF